MTEDDGKTWTELTANVPTSRWYSRVVPSQHAEGTVYVTQRGREDDDFGVYVYKSTDFGKTFTSLAANIPAGSVNVVREDPADANVLYLGTDFGAFMTGMAAGSGRSSAAACRRSRSRTWPTTCAISIIVIATYGRGMWALDALRLPR